MDKIQEYNRNWLQHVNRMAHDRLPRILKKLQTNKQKKPGETIKETCETGMGQQVAQLHVSIIIVMMMMDGWQILLSRKCQSCGKIVVLTYPNTLRGVILMGFTVL